jgi:hypothetical protein
MEPLLDRLEERLGHEAAAGHHQLTWARVVDSATSRTRHIRIENVAAAASPADFFAYRAAVFVVLCCSDDGGGGGAAAVVARFLTYNEETIETREFGLAGEQDLARIRYDFIEYQVSADRRDGDSRITSI